MAGTLRAGSGVVLCLNITLCIRSTRIHGACCVPTREQAFTLGEERKTLVSGHINDKAWGAPVSGAGGDTGWRGGTGTNGLGLEGEEGAGRRVLSRWGPRALGMALPWELVLRGSVHPFALTVCRCEDVVEAQDRATCGPR